MTLTANWSYPTAIRFGAGRISELSEVCRAGGISAPLVVTDPGLAALPMTEAIMSKLSVDGLGAALFHDVNPNPVEANVVAGVEAYRNGNHDGVVALGGGSGLDAGKAIAFMQGQDRPIWDFEDVGDWWTRANADAIAPVIAVPTTAGTGSEVGRASVITNNQTHEKKIIFHPKMMPETVIADPELTLGLPPVLTAATGMDAFAHNLEAWCAPSFHPMSAGIALEGMRIVKTWLKTAVHEGSNIDARSWMLVCSGMGATAFQRGLGGIHALSHPLGGLFGAHHGTLNAVLMPYVLEANKEAILSQMDDLANALGLVGGYAGVMKWVLDLRQGINMPHTLQDMGIDSPDFAQVGAMAVEDPSAGGNPIQFTAEQYAEICENAYYGNLS
ncbi:MAG: iron-containing alcohol dehydrogenase [Hyphomicrobiales bacterium]